MSDYYSNSAKVLNENASISSNLNSRARILIDYGADASATPNYMFDNTNKAVRTTFVLSNSVSDSPNMYFSWTYDKNDGTGSHNLDYVDPDWSGPGNNPFGASVSWLQDGSTWTYTSELSINTTSLDYNTWKNVQVSFIVAPYQDTESSPQIAVPPILTNFFEYDYGTPPAGIFYNPNLEDKTMQAGGVGLLAGLHSYQNISNVVWEYSDDNKITWQTLDLSQHQGSATSSQYTLDRINPVWGETYPPQITNRTESIIINQTNFTEGRYYRIKATAS